MTPLKNILSINETNKTNVPYLQGSFNQGGLATLVFSGKHRVNLIATRMAPSINKNHNDEWCFTIIRYVDPEILGKEVPILLPCSKGKVLPIGSDPIPALPDKDKNAYKVNLEHGAIVKCCGYDSGNWGGTENIAGKLGYGRALLNPLPIRFVDCRLHLTLGQKQNFTDIGHKRKINYTMVKYL